MAEGFSLYACNLLKSNYYRAVPGNVSKFPKHLEKISSLFLVQLQPADCKSVTKRELLEIFRRATFRNIPMHLTNIAV